MTEKNIKLINETITRLLARREHSRAELLNKLVYRGLDPTLCEQQLDKFTEQDIQSDERFADMLIRSKVTKGLGELRIRGELRQHSISGEVIEMVLTALQVDWFELARLTAAKKFGGRAPVDWREKQKRQKWLHNKGFSLAQIHYAVEELD